MIILSLYHWGITQLEKFSRTRFWAAKTIALVIAAALLFHAFPGVRSLLEPGDTFAAVLIKSDDLTRNLLLDYGPETNQAKQNFRLVMPALASILHLNVIGLYLVQVCFGVGILYLVLRLSERLTRDRVTAMLITILVATIYAGATGFIEVGGRFDAVSIFFLMLAIYTRNPLVILTSVFLTSWNDERGLIASTLVFAFHYLVLTEDKPRSIGSLLRVVLRPQLLAVLLGWGLYLISRFALASAFGLETAPVDVVAYFLANSNWWPFGIWTAFEGGWLLIFVAMCILVAQKRYEAFLLILGALGIILLTALSITDISRATAYALPGIFIALYVIAKHEEQPAMRGFAFVAALGAVLWPMYVLENGSWWIRPLPFQIFL